MVVAMLPCLRCLLKLVTLGDLIYTRLLGRDIVIINSELVAKELLENRSRNYSDRPYLVTRDLQVPLSMSHHQAYRLI